jgi:surfeit locus 1 family protein
VTGQRFQPGLASTVVLILLFPILCRLGLWQLDRATEKRALNETRQSQWSAPPLELSDTVVRHEGILPGRAVVARGRYRGPIILLDNRPRDGRTGYDVFSPLELDEGGLVMVARGWVPAAPDRSRVPDITVPDSPLIVRGRWGTPPSSGIRLDNDPTPPEHLAAGVSRIDRLEPGTLAQVLDQTVPAGVIYLDPGEENGYDRRWPVPTADVSKHQAYATQWFAMAFVLLLLYLKINFRPKASP